MDIVPKIMLSYNLIVSRGSMNYEKNPLTSVGLSTFFNGI